MAGIPAINMAGIPIVSKMGRHGGVYILEQYKFEKGIFNQHDIITMLRGIQIFHHVFDDEEIINTLNKINAIVDQNNSDEIEMKSSQVLFDPAFDYDKKLQIKLQMIHKNMKEGRCLQFIYWSSKAEETKRIIEPHRLVWHSNSWYLQGYCFKRREFRSFKLSRMYHMEPNGKMFEKREVPSLFQDYSAHMKSRLIKVRIRVHKECIAHVLDYIDGDTMEKIDPTYYEAWIDFISSDYDYGILLSFGDKCECIEPKFVRHEMEKRLQSISKLYLD